MIRVFLLLLALTPLFGCGESATATPGARILLLGDSMMASNAVSNESISDVIEAEMGQPVIDRAVVGARFLYALPISGALGLNIVKQYRPGPWDSVVLNGGGNDILFGCACSACDGVLNRLISADGSEGAIPAFVSRVRQSGARVIYVGYLRNPGTATPVKGCGPAGNTLDRRLAQMARRDPGVTFLSMADLVPKGDTSLHQLDRIHPSPKGSRAIAQRIVAELRRNPASNR